MIRGKREDNMEENTQKFLFLNKNFHFFCVSLKKINVKKTKKRLKFLERIFQFLRDILDILYSFRYSSSSGHFNYHFPNSFQMAIQICNPFGMQRIITEKRREIFMSEGAMPFLSCFEFYLPFKCCTFQKRIALQFC